VDKADGMIAVPEGPGLGFEINRDELEKYRKQVITV
jgi:L-alanine-DL-glutamate epimerase-like enolase superfamily enzyme